MSALAAASPQTDTGAEAYAAQLYEQHSRAVFGLCYSQLRRREDADDAVQTTFVYALLSLRRGVVPEWELPWLFTIARNVCSTRRRAGMRRGAHESAQDLDEIQDRIASPEHFDAATTEDFVEVLRAIPENQRRALLLREWRGLSYEEIGFELGLSQAATETLLFRARRTVAQRLRERTGLRAALHGLPFMSFLRGLLKSAAVKTLAVGACAGLTVVALPAAREQTAVGTAPRSSRPAGLARPPQQAQSLRASIRPRHVVPPPARNGIGAVPKAKHGALPARHANATASEAQDVPVAKAAETPSSSAPPPPQPASAPQSDPSPPTSLPPVVSVIETAAAVGGPITVPEVSLPDVQVPAVTVPLSQPPSIPSVQLP